MLVVRRIQINNIKPLKFTGKLFGILLKNLDLGIKITKDWLW